MPADPLPEDPRRRLALFESIIESMGESVLVVDREGRQVYGNRMLRIFRGEVAEGKNPDGWRHPSVMRIWDSTGRELPPEEWPVARALRGDFADNFEIRVSGMAHRDEDTILAISTRSLIDASGKIEGAVIVTRDITQMRQTEDILRQSQKLETIGQLTGGIAHDFNNMLAAILSAAEVLKRHVHGNERMDLAATTIEKAALRGAELTRHLLAFARKQALNPVEVDVDALIRETLALARPALGATIDMKVQIEEPLHALADPAQLASALLNLCINARDAMGDKGGAITISASRARSPKLGRGEFVRIAVADTGSGMSEETMRRAVEPFFTTKEVGKGSGLGLSMVYGFAQQSGGDLVITSELGRGTEMALLLPIAAAPRATQAIAEQRPEPTGVLRVMVVDDDELVRDALCLQLNDAGFDTIAATDGHQALALIDAGATFDLLLTDMVMPNGMNGMTLADLVRQRRPDVRVILSTGYVEKELPERGPHWLLLRKPYSSEGLFAALRAAMLGPR